MENIKEIVKNVNDVLEKYKNVPNIELEGRLGIYDQETKKFDSNIGEEYHGSISSMLNSFNGWESKETSNITDYFTDKLRLSVDNKTARQSCIEKKKLATFTYINENGSLDFRISISKEDPVRVDKFPNKQRSQLFQREKTRESYTLKKNKYELSKVNNKNKSGDIEEYYEYEVESKNIDNREQAIFSIIFKLLDATYACDGFLKTKDNTLPIENLKLFTV